MSQSDYQLQLQHPNWKRKAAARRKLDNYRCQICNRHKLSLHVHHIIYINDGREIWEYPMEYLQTLCEDCHRDRHEILRQTMNAFYIAVARWPTGRINKAMQYFIQQAFAEMEQPE